MNMERGDIASLVALAVFVLFTLAMSWFSSRGRVRRGMSRHVVNQ